MQNLSIFDAVFTAVHTNSIRAHARVCIYETTCPRFTYLVLKTSDKRKEDFSMEKACTVFFHHSSDALVCGP